MPTTTTNFSSEVKSYKVYKDGEIVNTIRSSEEVLNRPEFKELYDSYEEYIHPTRVREEIVFTPSWDELQLKRAFTQEERLAIRAARQTDPIVDDVMDLLEATVRSGGRVKANDPDFINGLNYFVSVDLLTEERKETILSGQPAVIVDPDSSPV